MRVVKGALALVLAMVLMAMPAAAGTRANPEVTDRCEGQIQADDSSLQVMHESVNICSMWFQGSGGSGGDTPTLKVNLTTQGDLEGRPGGLYWMAWQSGKCAYAAIVDDAVGAEMAQRLTVYCGETTTRTCTVPELDLGCENTGGARHFPLPDSSVAVDGDAMQVTVRFDGALAQFAKAHDSGSVLTEPYAFASQVIGPVYMHTYGCGFSLGDIAGCWGANGDLTENGRAYTVPQP